MKTDDEKSECDLKFDILSDVLNVLEALVIQMSVCKLSVRARAI